jgi:hypothetical protein
MPKPMYVWSGSAWVSVATEVESLANFATQSYADAQPGMKMIVPTSISVGSGSGSVNSNGTITFSGASSVTLNGIFSSTYDNYLFTVSNGSGTAAVGINFKLGSTATGYYSKIFYGAYNDNIVNGLGYSNTTTWENFGNCSSNAISINATIYNPFLSKSTTFTSVAPQAVTTGSYVTGGGWVNNTTSYTDATFLPSSGTISGTARIYGLKNG